MTDPYRPNPDQPPADPLQAYQPSPYPGPQAASSGSVPAAHPASPPSPDSVSPPAPAPGSMPPPYPAPFAPPYGTPESQAYAAPGSQPYAATYPGLEPQPYAAPLPAPYAPESHGYGYGGAYGYPGHPAPRPTEGLAVASLVVSCVAVLGMCAWGVGGLLGILGAIFGHVARRRIRQSGANGDGMALAGVVVGWATTAIGVVTIALFIAMIVVAEQSITY